MRTKIRVYAGLPNSVVYAHMKCVFWRNGCLCMIAMKITLTNNRQYRGSGKSTLSWRVLYNICYSSPTTELLATVSEETTQVKQRIVLDSPTESTRWAAQ